MAFQFRFASILQLRRRERDEAGAAVGQAGEAIARIESQINEVRQEQQSLRKEDNNARVGAVSVDTLLSRGRYDLQLQADEKSLNETRDKLLQELERRQSLLTAAEAEVKRFERLEEKERIAFQTKVNKREQAEADEASCRRYTLQPRR